MLKIQCKNIWPSTCPDDLIVLALDKKSSKKSYPFQISLNERKRAQDELKKKGFEGEAGSSAFLCLELAEGYRNVLFLGQGDLPVERMEVSSLAYERALKDGSCRILIASMTSKNLDFEILGMHIASYQFEKYKTKKKKIVLPSIFAYQASPLLGEHEKLMSALDWARDMVNEPPVELTPRKLVQRARKKLSLAAGNKSEFRSRVLLGDQLKKEKMGGILAVGKGSSESAAFLEACYRPSGAKFHLVLVGKGVTFDSGGLSLKPSKSMETMKMDMGGAAAMAGTLYAVMRMKTKICVTLLIGAAENMTGAAAVKPGDVIRSRSGQTIENLNTDAEGRIVLADLLDYGVSLKPDLMIDAATLTGACVVALGDSYTGIFSNQKKYLRQLEKCAEEAGERVWPLPLEKSYRKKLNSSIADMRNIGGKWGGAITAALFLQKFVKDTDWIHMDIAGPAMMEEESSLWRKGGTGAGIFSLVRLCEELSEKA